MRRPDEDHQLHRTSSSGCNRADSTPLRPVGGSDPYTGYGARSTDRWGRIFGRAPRTAIGARSGVSLAGDGLLDAPLTHLRGPSMHFFTSLARGCAGGPRQAGAIEAESRIDAQNPANPGDSVTHCRTIGSRATPGAHIPYKTSIVMRRRLCTSVLHTGNAILACLPSIRRETSLLPLRI